MSYRNLLSANVEDMEAMVTERGSEVSEWNDGRLDDLSERVGRIEKKMDEGFVHMDAKFTHVDAKFERLERKMDDGFARIDAKFDTFNERFENLHKMLFTASWAMAVGLLGLVGVMVTQS
jgi:hypothetical protein